MTKCRVLFKKVGRAKYISHLDLMHTIQRAFLRAGIGIRHTEGFNPHPYISIALPLSVGCESICELMDIDIESTASLTEIPSILNDYVPEGIDFLEAYERTTKVKDIKWIQIEGTLFYDLGIKADSILQLEKLFSKDTLMITKRTKRGFGETDIMPCIKSIDFSQKSDTEIYLQAIISAQEPSLNPAHIITAIVQNASDLEPDFSKFMRIELYDANMIIFR